MDQLDIRLFGSMQLMRDDVELTNFGSNKVRALFRSTIRAFPAESP